ncbi:hypothetical protein EVG20_g9763 [Dentipellis fragilis]|uniref:Uncharacterized protein n=1 Tax=Dentipellis fragilis TaxID=205917 RepID=A0A4Y9XVK7_9AGAM|nr:hypothetical protein EVG20_g9763 [Dentipellis fragilis]
MERREKDNPLAIRNTTPSSRLVDPTTMSLTNPLDVPKCRVEGEGPIGMDNFTALGTDGDAPEFEVVDLFDKVVTLLL